MFSLIKKAKRFLQDPKEIIAKIHNEFDTSAERLLNEANSILSQNLNTDKGDRLIGVGFVQSKPALSSRQVATDKTRNKKLATTIGHFTQWYPNNKFITEEKVAEICKKYGLLLGEVHYYTGDVPDKNLKEIENFKLREEDQERVDYNHYRYSDSPNMIGLSIARMCSPDAEGARYGYLESSRRNDYISVVSDTSKTHHFKKEPFKICASVNDFNTVNMEISKGYKLDLNLPDPIVLQPVNGGYLIVSKWGLEAEDADLVNEVMN